MPLLPLAVERQQGADLKVAGSDVKGVGDVAPVAQVAVDFPVVVGVVHDEEFAAGLVHLLGDVGHWVGTSVTVCPYSDNSPGSARTTVRASRAPDCGPAEALK